MTRAEIIEPLWKRYGVRVIVTDKTGYYPTIQGYIIPGASEIQQESQQVRVNIDPQDRGDKYPPSDYFSPEEITVQFEAITAEQAARDEAEQVYPEGPYTNFGTLAVVREAYVRGRLAGVPEGVRNTTVEVRAIRQKDYHA